MSSTVERYAAQPSPPATLTGLAMVGWQVACMGFARDGRAPKAPKSATAEWRRGFDARLALG